MVGLGTYCPFDTPKVLSSCKYNICSYNCAFQFDLPEKYKIKKDNKNHVFKYFKFLAELIFNHSIRIIFHVFFNS